MTVTSVLKTPIAAVAKIGRGIAKAGAFISVVGLWLAIIIFKIEEPEERD